MLLGLDEFSTVDLAGRGLTGDDVALGLVQDFDRDSERHRYVSKFSYRLKF